MRVSVLTENHHQTVTLTGDVTGLGLLTTILIPSGKQKPVDVAQVVCPLAPVHDVWRLNDPTSFLTESLKLS